VKALLTDLSTSNVLTDYQPLMCWQTINL